MARTLHNYISTKQTQKTPWPNIFNTSNQSELFPSIMTYMCFALFKITAKETLGRLLLLENSCEVNNLNETPLCLLLALYKYSHFELHPPDNLCQKYLECNRNLLWKCNPSTSKVLLIRKLLGVMNSPPPRNRTLASR